MFNENGSSVLTWLILTDVFKGQRFMQTVQCNTQSADYNTVVDPGGDKGDGSPAQCLERRSVPPKI